MMGFSSMRDFETVIKMNAIKNCPVVTEDIEIMKAIYGDYNVYALKGKTVKQKAKRVVRDYINVPEELKLKYQNVELCVDLMYVQGVCFLVTVSKHLKLITVEYLNDRSKMSLAQGLDSAFTVCNNEGYAITDAHADMEFECLRKELDNDDNNIKLHCVARKQHVPEIERCIKTIKERVRCLWHSLPYATMPRLMVKHMVSLSTWIMFTVD